MRLREALLLAVVVCSISLAGCATLSEGKPTSDTRTLSPQTATSETATTTSASTTTATTTPSPTTTRADYTRPTKHDLRIVNDLETDALVQLMIRNETNEPVLQQEFVLAAASNISQNLSYAGPRGAEYTISAMQNGTTATTSVQEPWNKLIYITITPEGIQLSIHVV